MCDAVQLFLACPFHRQRRTLAKRNDHSPSQESTQMTAAALMQRLLQMETTVKGLPSEKQKMQEEMMDRDSYQAQKFRKTPASEDKRAGRTNSAS